MKQEKLARLVVLISGTGSNLQALIDACEAKRLPAQIVAVVSNRPQAYGLQRAKKWHIPTEIHPHKGSRTEYDTALRQLVAKYEPDWIILAGWMRILSMAFLRHFPNRVINLHPALPGQFPGMHAIERAFEAAKAGQTDHTGVMVHLVPDEGVDDGPVLASQVVPIQADDTLETLTERIHSIEHELLIGTLFKLLNRAAE